MGKKDKKDKKGKKKSASNRISLKKIVYEFAKENYNDIRGKDMHEMVKGIFEAVGKKIQEGVNVSVKDFGIFKIVNRAARTGFNPRTKEKIEIEAKRTVKFKPNRSLKEGLNS